MLTKRPRTGFCKPKPKQYEFMYFEKSGDEHTISKQIGGAIVRRALLGNVVVFTTKEGKEEEVKRGEYVVNRGNHDYTSMTREDFDKFYEVTITEENSRSG